MRLINNQRKHRKCNKFVNAARKMIFMGNVGKFFREKK